MHHFISAAHTDKGIRKSINQDSVCLCTAATDSGEIVLAAVCDGMGGLAAGEHASAIMAREASMWFEQRLPKLVNHDDLIDFFRFQSDFEAVIQHAGKMIRQSSRGESGTTISAVLLFDGQYFTVNVGDSRVYRMTDHLQQLTKDQSYVQREVDAGHMTEEQARNHPRRNVLLQCVGAGDFVIPDFTKGFCQAGDCFLVCSDGFRHTLKNEEIEDAFYMEDVPTDDDLKNILIRLTDINKARKEKDNISAIAVYASDSKPSKEGDPNA